PYSLISLSLSTITLHFVFLLMIPPPPRSSLFPYTTLFRSSRLKTIVFVRSTATSAAGAEFAGSSAGSVSSRILKRIVGPPSPRIDRKSTRLNSSHVKISYAVFCLKKKKRRETGLRERFTSH